MERIQVRKEELKLSLFANDMCLYLKDSTKKKKRKNCLDLIKIFSKVGGYKINIQKSVAFLYTSNKYAEK
jgi:hypothetical protein